jgi:malate synthase
LTPREPAHAEAETVVEPRRIRVLGQLQPGFEEILNPDALAYIASLTVEFGPRLRALLDDRERIHERIRGGELPRFLGETRNIRESSWKVAPIPQNLKTRRVEITGPVDRKMVINALNSGADVYMADFEDSHSPTWNGTINGQMNLRDAVRGTIEYTAPDGRIYRLNDQTSVLFVRPRGLHLVEKHVLVGEDQIPASLFDYGLFLYHNAENLMAQRAGLYFYLPKMENHREARFWNEVFDYSEKMLGLPKNSIRCSVLIENILAAFEMDEILYELRNRITALNFGRWDYIFSMIKILGQDKRFVLPERPMLPMTTEFLKSCSLLLVETCHKRGAYAIGGMAAQVPVKSDPRVQEAIGKVVEDKKREASEGYEGAWVAHPGLVPVIMKVFHETTRKVNGSRTDPVPTEIDAGKLLSTPPVSVSEEAVRANISVSLRYLESWLGGTGCVAINNLMEDTATVEICRAQLWQWIRHSAVLVDGRTVTLELFRSLLGEELAKIESETGRTAQQMGRARVASGLLDSLVSAVEFPEFLTLLAYDLLA